MFVFLTNFISFWYIRYTNWKLENCPKKICIRYPCQIFLTLGILTFGFNILIATSILNIDKLQLGKSASIFFRFLSSFSFRDISCQKSLHSDFAELDLARLGWVEMARVGTGRDGSLFWMIQLVLKLHFFRVQFCKGLRAVCISSWWPIYDC